MLGGNVATRRALVIVAVIGSLVFGPPVVAHAAVGSVTEYPIPSALSGALEIAAGPDGNVWFVEDIAGKIGRITPTGSVTEFPVPAGALDPSRAQGITAGPDGNLWFVEDTANKIGRITIGGVITEFAIPTATSNPWGITSGPDGNLWFAEVTGNKIGRITTGGSVTEFSIPSAGSFPSVITTGPDGNLWFTQGGANDIGRITTSGVVTEFPLSTVGEGIAAGPDGNLWFTEDTVNKIGRITTTGTVTEYAVPTSGQPQEIVAGTDGNLWFTDPAALKIRRVTPTGAFAEFTVPNPGNSVGGICLGPGDGNLWFTTGVDANRIGRLTDARAGTKYVSNLASGFAPVSRTVPKGDTVRWIFAGPVNGSATDTTGMGLFDSGTRSFVTYFDVRFDSAGTYHYQDSVTPSHAGTIRVPISVSPKAGTVTTTVAVVWSAGPAQAGFVFDVQIKRPGSTSFVGWMVSQTVPSATFVPDVGTGTYTFRARLRNAGSQKASGWSPSASCVVS